MSSKLESVGSDRRRKTPIVPCPHCHRYLSLKTYKKHERLYYKPREDQWEQSVTDTQDDDEGECFEFLNMLA